MADQLLQNLSPLHMETTTVGMFINVIQQGNRYMYGVAVVEEKQK